MQVSNLSNYFKWFDLPETYDINLNDLQEKYYRLSRKTHPDNFYNKSQFEIQTAQQALQYTHQAYEALYCPVKRASYFLLLNNIDLSSESIQQQPLSPDFLEKIFDWQAQPQDKKVKRELEENINLRLSRAAEFLKNNHFDLAIPLVRELMFIKKIGEQS